MSKFEDIIILILIGGFIALFIALFIDSFGDFEYTDFGGNKGKAHQCYSRYSQFTCVIEDNEIIRVQSYKKV